MSDIVATTGMDNAGFKAGADQAVKIMEQAKARSEKVMASFGGGVKFALAFGGLDSAASLAERALAGVRRGLDFNAELNNAEVGIANVLAQFQGLDDIAAKRESAKAMAQIAELEPKTAGTMSSLVEGFMATVAAAQQVGMSVEQNVDLVGKFANVLGNAGLPANQLAQEMRSIITGSIGADSSVAKILNISNEDVNAAREAGNIYEWLSGKLGKLGEAGDSAGVRFSTLQSAIDKQLASLTKPMFDMLAEGAVKLSEALNDEAFGGKIAELGEDLGQAARELGELAGWAAQAAPGVAAVMIQLARISPALVAMAAGWMVLKGIDIAKSRLAEARGIQAATAAITQETVAVRTAAAAHDQETAALKRKAAARAGASLVGADTTGFKGGSSINLQGLAQQIAAQRTAGQQAATGFMTGFRSGLNNLSSTAAGQMLTSMNGMTPMVVSALTRTFVDPADALGGQMGMALADGVSFALAGMGPYGILAGVAAQAFVAAPALGQKLGESIANSMSGEMEKIQATGTRGITDLLEQGEGDKAAALLAQRKAEAQAAIDEIQAKPTMAAADYGKLEALQQELQILQTLEKSFERIKTQIQEKKQAEKAAAEEQKRQQAAQKEFEEKAKAAKAQAEANAKAWQEIKATVTDINKQKIDVLPDPQKLEALRTQLRQVFEDAALNGGAGVNSTAALEAQFEAQKKAGDIPGAAKTLERLKAALALEKEMAAIQEKMRADAAAAGEASEATNARKAELELETKIQEAIAATGSAESEEVKTLERQLAIKQEQERLMQSLNMSAADALSLAERRVNAEAGAKAAIEAQQKAQQQGSAMGGLMEEARILEAKANGQDKLAEKLEREASIRARAQQIMDQTGVSQERAMQMAKRMQDLSDKAESRGRETAESGGQDSGRKSRIRTNMEQVARARNDWNSSRLDAHFGQAGRNVFPSGKGETALPLGKVAAAAAQSRNSEGNTTLLSEIKAVMEQATAHLERLSAE